MRWHVITEGSGQRQPRLGPAQVRVRRQGAQVLPRNTLLILHPYPSPKPLAPHATRELRRSRWSQRKKVQIITSVIAGPRGHRRAQGPKEARASRMRCARAKRCLLV